MFGRHFAFGFQGAEGEGGPPWFQGGRHHGPRFFGMHRGRGPFGFRGPFGHHGPFHHGEGEFPFFEEREGRGPRFFGMHRGRGPFGPGGPFGHHGPFGGGEGRRFFGRGDVKFALLQLLQERPMHGYEMIKALEEKSSGFYSPSPGSIYPTLQMLEDGGFVTSSDVEGKKVYSITDAGRTLLAERQKEEESFGGPPWMRGFHGGRRGFAEMQALRAEVVEVTRLLAIAGRMSFRDAEQLTRLRGIIERTRKDLADMIYGSGSQQGEQPSTPPAGQE